MKKFFHILSQLPLLIVVILLSGFIFYVFTSGSKPASNSSFPVFQILQDIFTVILVVIASYIFGAWFFTVHSRKELLMKIAVTISIIIMARIIPTLKGGIPF